LDSFNYSMEGKFGIQPKLGPRAKTLSYDLNSVSLNQEVITVVDIGDDKGEMAS